MNFVVIGLGSMGKRRISLLKKFSDIFVVGVDNNEEKRKETEDKYGICTYTSLEDALLQAKIDAAFVCTSPLYHGQIINNCLNNSINVFTEINLINDYYKENMELAKKKKLLLFLSSTFLYRYENLYIINRVSHVKEKFNYVYHVGQYLPDWHPWENYTNFFVGNKKTNGCREIFAIELPWIETCFGKIKGVIAQKNNISSLELGYPDSYFVQLTHENGNKGIIAVDVVSRKPVRKIEIMSDNVYISWNGTPETLYEYDVNTKNDVQITTGNNQEHRDGYADFVTENPYFEEIASFIKALNGDFSGVKWNFQKDYDIINIIDKIEEII